MNYLIGYSIELQQQVSLLISQNRLIERLQEKYPSSHAVRTDKSLYAYVLALKGDFIRHAATPSKVVFDNDLRTIQRALGLHTAISRVQGGKLKAKNEIRIAALFKYMPIEFLKMIVVHELAHLREKDHNKAFYKLCVSMEQDYHQIEFDLRLYLTHAKVLGSLGWSREEKSNRDWLTQTT